MELTPDSTVQVTAGIDDGQSIRENEVAAIRTSLLGGNAVIDIIKSGQKDEPRTPVPPGAKIQGMVYADPLQVASKLEDRLSGAIDSVSRTSVDLSTVSHKISQLIDSNQQGINRIVKQTDDATEQLRQLGHSANDVFGSQDAKARFQQTLNQVQEILAKTNTTEDRVNELVASLQKNSENLNKFTGALGDNGAAVISQLGQSAQKLDVVLAQMVKLTGTLNSKEGSLGQLINDPTLYQRINTTTENIEDLSRQLKPVLRNVNLLTDQLARHPEKLGLRGALERSQGTKWPSEPAAGRVSPLMDADP